MRSKVDLRAAAFLSGTGLLSLAIGVASSGTAATAAAAGPGSVGGNVAIGWSIPGVPAGGVANITFPMTVNPATLRTSGVYFAQQYNFTNAPDVGYTGLQPIPDLNGHQRLHGVFSSFNAGTTSTDPNCHDGADNGAGVSCKTEYDAVYGHTYNITVARTGTDTWTGTVVDTVTGAAVHIGTYTLPAGSGNLRGSQGGFVEYFLGKPSCAQLSGSDVVFGPPSSTDAGGLRGTTNSGYEYSECIGQANYHVTPVGGGVHIVRGWTFQPGVPGPAGPGSSSRPPTTPPATGHPTPSKPGASSTPSASASSPATPTPAAPSGPDVSGSVPAGGAPGSSSSDAVENAATAAGGSSALPLAAAVGVGGAVLVAGVWYWRRGQRRGAQAARRDY